MVRSPALGSRQQPVLGLFPALIGMHASGDDDMPRRHVGLEASGDSGEQYGAWPEHLGGTLGDDRGALVARADLGDDDPPGRAPEEPLFEAGSTVVLERPDTEEFGLHRLVLHRKRGEDDDDGVGFWHRPAFERVDIGSELLR